MREAVTPARLLSNIHVFRCVTLAEQTALVHALPAILRRERDGADEGPAETAAAAGSAGLGRVKLVILDSVAFHCRYSSAGGSSGSGAGPFGALLNDASMHAAAGALGGNPYMQSNQPSNAANRTDISSDMAARARHLQATAQSLHKIASLGVAVVVVNQVTTKIAGRAAGRDAAAQGEDLIGAVAAANTNASSMIGADALAGSADGSGGRLVPALGETWAHACTHRVMLGWPKPGVAFPLSYGAPRAQWYTLPPHTQTLGWSNLLSSHGAGNAAFASSPFHSVRLAQLMKSPYKPPAFVAYAVVPDGVRGFLPPSTGAEAGVTAESSTQSQRLAGAKRTATEAGV
jgi:hypothetical protein